MKKSDVYTKIADAGRLGLMVTLTPKRAGITANTLLTMARTIDLLQKTIDAQKLAIQTVPGLEEYGPLQNNPEDYPTEEREPQRYTEPERSGLWRGVVFGLVLSVVMCLAAFGGFYAAWTVAGFFRVLSAQ